MKTDKSQKSHRPMKTSTKVLLTIMGILVVAIVALGILERCGIMPVDGEIVLYVPLLAVFVLLGWGIYALVGRIDKRGVKVAVGVGLSILLMVVLMIAFSYISYMGFYALPHRYSTIAAPSGAHKLVVMRAFDTDEGRMEQRRKARLEANPDGDPEFTLEDWGYIYKAYPQVAKWFYRINADVEGEVYLPVDGATVAQDAQTVEGDGEAPQADPPVHSSLMVEWLEDEAVAHFFAQNPGAGDGGDCYVRF